MYIILLLLLLLVFFYYSEFYTYNIAGFNVKDSSSAELLKVIHTNIVKLQNYMREKYTKSNYVSGYNMYARTRQFIENYKPDNIYEISPYNLMGNTSFTQYKKKMVFCLRDKSNKLHDINTVMFVVLHELTHLMNDRWGHESYFWGLFHIVLRDAVSAGVYKAVDYEDKPQNYCGMSITQNPYFNKVVL